LFVSFAFLKITFWGKFLEQKYAIAHFRQDLRATSFTLLVTIIILLNQLRLEKKQDRQSEQVAATHAIMLQVYRYLGLGSQKGA